MPPRSFNQVLLEELRQLRPKAFRDVTQAEGMVRWGVSDAEWDANRDALAKELRELYARLGRLKDSEDGQGSLAALCLSGGGIRSATFNLGVLQGLAERNLLDRFDYLSSVSGGGYIASWLNAWIHREGRDKVLRGLARSAADRGANPLAPEPRPLDHLREFSNYLTPRAGLFSPDAWMLAATVLRNILLNWLVILPLLVAVLWIPLMLPRVLELEPPPGALVLLFILSLACGLVASYFAHRYRRLPYRQDLHQWTVVVRTVLPLYAAALLLSWAAAWQPWQDWCCAGLPPSLFGILCALAWTLGVPLAGWWLVGWERAGSEAAGTSRLGWPVHDLLGLLVSGLVAGGLLLALAQWPAPIATEGARALYVVLALPALLATYVVARAISAAVTNLGVLRHHDADRRLKDHDLEWWARYSGWVLLFAVGWAAVTALCLYGPVTLRMLPGWGKAAVAAMGGVSGLVVRALGRSAATPAGRRTTTDENSPARNWALALAAPFFIALLIAVAALGVTDLVRWVAAQRNALALADLGEWAAFGGAILLLSLPVGIFAGVAWLLGLLVNTNDFSLHGMYRNRLVRAYLGASNPGRKPDPFTGFARDDDLPLHELRRDARTGESVRPMPVINVALNLVTTGEKLAWQQRKAESFSMTPLYCGNFHDGYRDTARYGGHGGITLGTAMAISGAAANPNMGYHSSPAITFLLGLFNARLGVWLGNTNSFGDETYMRSGPPSAVGPLVAELLGLTSARGPFVNLSDGGHFENLGLYEMVLRRCRYIVVCDAGCDPGATFEDLGNAIRKIRIDFGISIEFPLGIQIRGRDEGVPGLSWATGVINYREADGAEVSNGEILYIKPTYYGRKRPPPYDVVSYAESSRLFPQEPTTDQWFDESQFESYRALGRFVVSEMLGGGPRRSVAEAVQRVSSTYGTVPPLPPNSAK